jgi:uncharacterized membrane protein
MVHGFTSPGLLPVYSIILSTAIMQTWRIIRNRKPHEHFFVAGSIVFQLLGTAISWASCGIMRSRL